MQASFVLKWFCMSVWLSRHGCYLAFWCLMMLCLDSLSFSMLIAIVFMRRRVLEVELQLS